MNFSNAFFPIILGSDENAYGTVRLLREAYGVRPLILCKLTLTATKGSQLFDLRVIPHLDTPEVFVSTMKAVLDEMSQRYEKLVVIACSDYYTRLMSVHFDEFEGRVANYYPSAALLDRLDRKDSFYELCEKYGLDHPETHIVTPSLRKEAPDQMHLSFPIVMKPENSNAVEYLNCRFEGKKKVFFLSDRKSYDAVIDAMGASNYQGNLILQEFIPGGDDAMRVINTYSDNEGKVRFMCCGQPILEEYSPHAIGNYAAIISRSDDTIYRKIENFLNAIGYVGFANFDIKFDSRTGRYYLFEINARPGRSSFFIRAAEHNLMKYMVDSVVFGKREPVVYNRKEALWTAVPKGVLMKYVSSPALKKEIRALWRQKRPARTLFAPEDTSLMRRLRVLRYYYSYYKSFRKYYFDKEGMIRSQDLQ